MSARRSVATLSLSTAVALAVAGCGSVTPSAADRSASPAATAPSPTPEGDVGPHEVENNSWRQRRPLSPEDQRLGEEKAPLVGSVLDGLRDRNEFAVESVIQALAGLGFDRRLVQVQAMTMSTGVVYGVPVGVAGCIYGDLRPERSLVEVDGPSRESGCIQSPIGH